MFNFSLHSWMNLERSCSVITGQLDALCACAKHTLHYRTLSRPSVDSVMTTNEWGGLMMQHLHYSKWQFRLHFRYIIVRVTWFLTIQWFYSYLGYDLNDDYSTSVCCLISRLAGPLGAAASSFVSEVACYTHFCNPVPIFVLQHACVLALRDCGRPSTKMLFRTVL